MTLRINYDAVERRIGRSVLHCNAEYELVACELCGHHYLADHEILTVYLDPDLKDSFLDIQGEVIPACRGCGAAEWNCEPVSKANSEWVWVVGEED